MLSITDITDSSSFPMSQNAQNAKGKESVRRRLFESEPNSEQPNMTNTVNEVVAAASEEAKAKWNFDFENEEPLEGDWEWQKVETNEIRDLKEDDTENKNRNL